MVFLGNSIMSIKKYFIKWKKIISNLLICLMIVCGISQLAMAKSIESELPECTVITHCYRVNWEVDDVEESFQKTLAALKKMPRTEIIDENESYIHAEAKTKWLRYIDDLEIKSIPQRNILQVRSESRVGIGDNGVNKKRVEDLGYRFGKINK